MKIKLSKEPLISCPPGDHNFFATITKNNIIEEVLCSHCGMVIDLKLNRRMREKIDDPHT